MSSQQASAADAVGHLFERPTEPVFNRKGGNGGFQFVLPESYYVSYTPSYKCLIFRYVNYL